MVTKNLSSRKIMVRLLLASLVSIALYVIYRDHALSGIVFLLLGAAEFFIFRFKKYSNRFLKTVIGFCLLASVTSLVLSGGSSFYNFIYYFFISIAVFILWGAGIYFLSKIILMIKKRKLHSNLDGK